MRLLEFGGSRPHDDAVALANVNGNAPAADSMDRVPSNKDDNSLAAIMTRNEGPVTDAVFGDIDEDGPNYRNVRSLPGGHNLETPNF